MANLKKLPFQNETFDIVFSSMVFANMNKDDWERGLREVKRVLKKNGKLIIIEHCKKGRNCNNLLKINKVFEKPICGFLYHLTRPFELMYKLSIKVAHKIDKLFSFGAFRIKVWKK